MNRPILVEIDAVHPCWCIESIEKAGGEGIIKGLSGLHETRDSHTLVAEVTAPEVDRLLSALRRHPWVKQLDVLSKTREYALVNVRSKVDKLMYERIVGTRSTPLMPSYTGGGHDSLAVIVPSDNELRRLYSLLKDDFEVKVRRKKYLEPVKPVEVSLNVSYFLEFRAVRDLLSQKQLEAFVLASEKGYFSLPKRTSIEELAAQAGVHTSAFSERLRKAEAKLIPFIAQVMKQTNAQNKHNDNE